MGSYKFVWKEAIPSGILAGIFWLGIVIAGSINAHTFLWPLAVILGIAVVPIGLSGGVLPADDDESTPI
jgi:hypothetical protein